MMYFTVSLFNPLVCLFFKDDYRKNVGNLLQDIKNYFLNKQHTKKRWVEMELSPMLLGKMSAENHKQLKKSTMSEQI